MSLLVSPPYFARMFYPEALWRKPAGENKTVYLTFDDGPIPIVTEWVLDFLRSEEIKASFFCVGNNVALHPEIFKKVNEEGHITANHSFNHLNGWQTDNETYFENIEKCNGFYTNNLFRPPHGRIKLSQYNHLKKQYKLVFWDVVSFDFDVNTSPQKCFQNVRNNVRDGSIIVFHDSLKAQRNLESALPETVRYLKNEGYTFSLLPV